MNRFFSLKNPNFRHFLAQIGPKKFFRKIFFFHNKHTLILRLCTKNQEKLMNRFFIKSKKPYFWAFFGPNRPKKKFFEKNFIFHNKHTLILRLCTKNQEKLMDWFFKKSKKPYFWAHFGPNWPKKIFFGGNIFFIISTL